MRMPTTPHNTHNSSSNLRFDPFPSHPGIPDIPEGWPPDQPLPAGSDALFRGGSDGGRAVSSGGGYRRRRSRIHAAALGDRARLGRSNPASSPGGRGARGVTKWCAVSAIPKGGWRGRQPRRPRRARSPATESLRLTAGTRHEEVWRGLGSLRSGNSGLKKLPRAWRRPRGLSILHPPSAIHYPPWSPAGPVPSTAQVCAQTHSFQPTESAAGCALRAK